MCRAYRLCPEQAQRRRGNRDGSRPAISGGGGPRAGAKRAGAQAAAIAASERQRERGGARKGPVVVLRMLRCRACRCSSLLGNQRFILQGLVDGRLCYGQLVEHQLGKMDHHFYVACY